MAPVRCTRCLPISPRCIINLSGFELGRYLTPHIQLAYDKLAIVPPKYVLGVLFDWYCAYTNRYVPTVLQV